MSHVRDKEPDVWNEARLLQEAQRGVVSGRDGLRIQVDLVGSDSIDLSYILELQDCDFRGSKFIDTRMREAQLQGSILRGVDMLGVDLTDGDLGVSPNTGQRTDLSGARLIRANLQRANLSRAILTQADLGEADLSGADLRGASLRRANLRNTILHRTLFDRSSLGKSLPQEEEGEFLEAKFIYLSLKNNFTSIGAYDDAAWAYVRERIMERKSFSLGNCSRFYSDERDETMHQVRRRVHGWFRQQPEEGAPLYKICNWLGDILFHVRYLIKWLESLLIGAPWAYGQRPLNAIGICVSIILLFAVIFWFAGGIQTDPPRELEVLDVFVYSIGSFAIVGFGDMYPGTLLAKYLTVGEALLGLTTFALFINALGQRIGGR